MRKALTLAKWWAKPAVWFSAKFSSTVTTTHRMSGCKKALVVGATREQATAHRNARFAVRKTIIKRLTAAGCMHT